MATRRKSEDENVNDASLERVIGLLEPKDISVKPCTKKEACSILNIAYNTTRLASLIEKYKEKKQREIERRAALRGKAATEDEVKYVISEYLEGNSIDAISKATYRSVQLIHSILEKYAVPTRASGASYFRPAIIPDGAMRAEFKLGEIVWSARYESLARIDHSFKTKDNENGYRIWLLAEKWKQSANQPASELASLEHLTAIGVKF